MWSFHSPNTRISPRRCMAMRPPHISVRTSDAIAVIPAYKLAQPLKRELAARRQYNRSQRLDLYMDSKMDRRDFLGTVALAGAVAATARSSLISPAAAAPEAGSDIITK